MHPTSESIPAIGPQSPDTLTARHELVELVANARTGDARAWDRLVNRYSPLVNSVCRRHRLSQADAEDVGQVVWLRLFENLGAVREVHALPGWVRTTARNEALHVLMVHRCAQPVDPLALAALDQRRPDEEVDRDLLRSELSGAVQDGLAELAPEYRKLLVLLHAEPRTSYRDIGNILGIPTGSIGPTRARCLAKLRQTNALRTFVRSTDGRVGLEAA